MNYKVEVFKSAHARYQPWYFRLVSDNGQVVAQSEGYFSKWNAKRAASKAFPQYDVIDTTVTPYKKFP